MPNYPRMFAYATGTFTIGVAVYLFTNMFLPFVQRQDSIGTVFLLGYALIYASITAAVARRFIKKTLISHVFPYVLVPVMTVPAMILIYMKGEFALPTDQIVYYAVTVAGSAIGAWAGIRGGHRKRDEHIAQLQLEQAALEQKQGRSATTGRVSASGRAGRSASADAGASR